SGAARGRRRAGHRRGAPAYGPRAAYPRRAPGARRRALYRDGRGRGRALEAGSARLGGRRGFAAIAGSRRRGDVALRDPDREGRTRLRVLDRQIAAQLAGERACGRQPQAVALDGRVVVQTRELVEDRLPVLDRYSGAVVGDLDDQPLAGP